MKKVGSKYVLMATAGALAFGGLALLPTGNARANLITNGDFSANASSYTVYPGYSDGTNPVAPTGWTVSGVNSGVNGPDTGFYSDTTNGGAPFAPVSTTGVRDFNFMQGLGLSSTQTVSTTTGEMYTLTFDAAQRAGDTGAVLNAILTDATNNTTIATFTPAINDNGFTLFTYQFTATSAQTTLEFLNSSPAGDYTVDVSNVSIAVPEPATLGLMAAGGLGLLLMGWKRKMA